MFYWIKKLTLLFITLSFVIPAFSMSADSHTPNMNFSFLPKFVHYQGDIIVNGKSLSDLQTGIDFIEIKFINQKQTASVGGNQVELEDGQFIFTTIYGDPIESKYHIDIGPGVPEKTIFDIYVAGVKAKDTLIFDPSPVNGCPVSNCFNRTIDIVIDTIPTPTPTPIPPTPTSIPTANPSFYSGVIVVGSETIPDNVEVFAKISDYISEIVKTSDGKYSLTVSPKTINYVGQDIYLIIQGNQSITSIPFSPDEFINDANFFFEDFEILIPLDPVATPEPEKIIKVATATPGIQDIGTENSLEGESGGCSGGGSSKISIFSIFTSIFTLLIIRKIRKFKYSSV